MLVRKLDSVISLIHTVENIQVEGVRLIFVWMSQSKLFIDPTI